MTHVVVAGVLGGAIAFCWWAVVILTDAVRDLALTNRAGPPSRTLGSARPSALRGHRAGSAAWTGLPEAEIMVEVLVEAAPAGAIPRGGAVVARKSDDMFTSRPLSRDRTRCPRCPASRSTTHCRHRQAVAARYRAERDQSCAFGLQRGQARLTREPGADPHVKMQPVLDDLAFGNALEEQSRARTEGSMHANAEP